MNHYKIGWRAWSSVSSSNRMSRPVAALIHRLQTNQGADGFNNMFRDSRGPGADGSVRVDFAAHVRSLGCSVIDVPDGSGVEELRAAYLEARDVAVSSRRPAVVLCRTHPTTWTEAGAW